MRLLILSFILCLFASSTVAQDVKVQSNPNTDFSKFKSYSWIKGAQIKNPLVHQIVVDAVEQQLNSRGLSRKDTDGDLQVMYLAAMDMELQAPQPSWSSAGGTSLSTGIATIGVPWEVRKGTLLIDLIDKTSTNMVWRSYATKMLNHTPTANAEKDAKKVEKPLRNAIAKMFKKYPIKGTQ